MKNIKNSISQLIEIPKESGSESEKWEVQVIKTENKICYGHDWIKLRSQLKKFHNISLKFLF